MPCSSRAPGITPARDAAFRLAQDGKDSRFAESARLHQNLLDHKAREDSTFDAR